MKVLIIYCHPSKDSFTYKLRERFIQGLEDAGHSYIISDLYAEDFNDTLSEQEYRREGFYQKDQKLPQEVIEEQLKINSSDAIVFIYPVFWTEAPAKLVGWFQRVWTYGFAYGEIPTMKMMKKALFLVSMGGSLSEEIRQQQVDAMKCVMLGDRIHDRAEHKDMIFFDEMTRGYGNDRNREKRIEIFLEEVYQLALEF
jgi:Putative NADPH-quinone reductase (modulator of drug activity B)